MITDPRVIAANRGHVDTRAARDLPSAGLSATEHRARVNDATATVPCPLSSAIDDAGGGAALRVPPRATRLSLARGAICMRSLSLQARL